MGIFSLRHGEAGVLGKNMQAAWWSRLHLGKALVNPWFSR